MAKDEEKKVETPEQKKATPEEIEKILETDRAEAYEHYQQELNKARAYGDRSLYGVSLMLEATVAYLDRLQEIYEHAIAVGLGR